RCLHSQFLRISYVFLMLSFLCLAITNGLCQDIAPPDEPSSFFSVLAMKKERPQRALEPGAPPPSLRDYWIKPTGFPSDQPGKPTRRTPPSVTTPSLWEPSPMLSPFSASPLAPTQESNRTVGAEPIV